VKLCHINCSGPVFLRHTVYSHVSGRPSTVVSSVTEVLYPSLPQGIEASKF